MLIKIKKGQLCATCRAGAGELEPDTADVFVKGKVPAASRSGWRPYRGYLCRSHLEMMLDDGAIFSISIPLNQNKS